jgi:uncharacterized membrane protein
MLLIPFPFVTASVFITALLVLRGVVLDRGERLSLFFTAFIAMCAVQSLLIGFRHGYGVMALAPLLPVSAMLIPPLTWASFARPPVDRSWLESAAPCAQSGSTATARIAGGQGHSGGECIGLDR